MVAEITPNKIIEMTGYVYKPDGIWYYGNGDITPYNWSKEFQQQVKPKTKKIIQLTLFTNENT